MDTREKILDFLRLSGPIIPVKLAKELNTNILMASAFLSELVSSGKIKVSHLKIGGSPLYYLPGHEYKLQNFSNNIGAKEKVVYDKLYKEKVLQDKSLEPVERVTIRELKDFAIQTKFENEVYWKWYLISENDAISLIKNNYQKSLPLKAEIFAEEPQKNIQPIQETEIHATLGAENKPQIIEVIDYIKKVTEYFEHNKIDILETKGKKSDIEYTVKVPSQIGTIICYCKTKFKKHITDVDISSAYMQSQYRGLPLLFLYSGELTKKALEMLKEYQGVIIKKI